MSGAVCIWCEGRGKVRRYIASLRRRAEVTCARCKGSGRS